LDNDWLKSKGYAVVKGIAEFWASRVKLENGVYVINGVIPPDEYAVNINNSVYTNIVAKMSLEFAIKCGQLLNDTTIPVAQWRKIADNIKIPFDKSNNIHLEFDGYDGKKIKQADVVLLGYPLMYQMSKDVRYNDLIYYEARTDKAEGPAMTYSMHVVGFLELDMPDQAARLFPTSYANHKPPFDVWTETPIGGAVNFVTGCGGFLQGVLFGYGGLRIHPDRIGFTTNIPPNANYMKLRGVNYLGSTLSISYNSTTTTILVEKQGPKYPLYLQVQNLPHAILKEGIPAILTKTKSFTISIN